MATDKLLAPNGTLKEWKVNGIDVLFPEQTLLINGKEKLRGGAPVCCPIFGKMPDTEDYKGLNLPQHGLVRLGSKHTRLTHDYLGTQQEICDYFSGKQSWEHYEHYRAHFDTPWNHSATIVLETAVDNSLLSHILFVQFTPQDKTECMPISACLHPYFSTQGEEFYITHGHTAISSHKVQEGVSISIEREKSKKLYINLRDGTIIIDLPYHSAYTHFNVWTDCIKKYICVEPYFGLPTTHYLWPGQSIEGHCYMHYFPK